MAQMDFLMSGRSGETPLDLTQCMTPTHEAPIFSKQMSQLIDMIKEKNKIVSSFGSKNEDGTAQDASEAIKFELTTIIGNTFLGKKGTMLRSKNSDLRIDEVSSPRV